MTVKSMLNSLLKKAHLLRCARPPRSNVLRSREWSRPFSTARRSLARLASGIFLTSLGTGFFQQPVKKLALLFLLLFPLAVGAQEPSERWRRLSPEEKALIERNYQRWNKLPPNEKEHLQQEWQHWRSLPPEQRQELQRRFQEFRQLPPQERQQWRQKFQERGKLSPDEERRLRERLRDRLERHQ